MAAKESIADRQRARPRGGQPERSLPRTTDLVLLDAARTMDERAITEIFDLYATALYKYALRITCDPVVADNVVADAFARLLDQFSRHKGPRTNLRSYLYQTTYHLAVDRARENVRTAPLEIFINWKNIHQESIEEIFEQQALYAQVRNAMNRVLTEDQRHVIILRFCEDFSLKETAAIVEKEVSNVKVIQNRGMAKLRNELGPWYEDTIKKKKTTPEAQPRARKKKSERPGRTIPEPTVVPTQPSYGVMRGNYQVFVPNLVRSEKRQSPLTPTVA